MKTITIGRSDECDIHIEHELISRRHALLRISPLGKMEIINLGANGTSVNGVKLQNSRPKKISRNDVVTFAGVKTLDFNAVPDTLKLIRIGSITAILLVIVAISITILSLNKNKDSNFSNSDDVGYSSSSGTSSSEVKKEDVSGFEWPSFLNGTNKSSKNKEKKDNKGSAQTEETPNVNNKEENTETSSSEQQSPKDSKKENKRKVNSHEVMI